MTMNSRHNLDQKPPDFWYQS